MNLSQNPRTRTGILTASRTASTVAWLGALLLGTSLKEAQAQTPVSGSLSSDTTWTLANSPYQMTGSVTVNAGVTLTIEAGVQVVVSSYQVLQVDGSLRAIGTAEAPITFTGTTETANWWNGIVVRNAGSATLEHARVRSTGFANNAGLLKTGTGDLTLRRTTFEHNGGAGLYLQAGYGSFIYEQNTFSHNARGVHVGLNASFIDDDASTYSHNGSDVYLNGGTVTTDTRWYLNPAHSMLVSASLTIDAEAHLEILPGTVVKFTQYRGLVVDGTLEAIGSAMAPIVFTDWRDDTAGGDANGDGNATLPAPNWWNGIVVRNAGSATLEHARVRYAGFANNAGLLKTGTGDLTLRRTTFEHNGGAGLYLQAGYGSFTFEQNAFSHNTRGVQVGLNASFLDDDASTYSENGAAVSLNGGTLTADTQYYLNPAYSMLVSASLTIDAGAHLEILPGTVVKFTQYRGLVVDGTLEAIGSAMAPIVFTDWRDDTAGGDANGDGNATLPAPNWWNGIEVRNAGSATLEHARVRYTGFANNAGLLKTGTGDLTLRRTTFEHNGGAGLYLQAGYGSFTFEQNAFSHNTRGVQVGLNASFLDDDASTYSENGAAVSLNGGTLTADTQYYLNPAYSMLVSASLTIDAGAHLEILPGTVVKFTQYRGLVVDGTLEAIGTAMAPIVFTDWRDDTAGGDANGDGNATLPAPNWWNGIEVRNTGSATLEHARVRYAGFANNAGLVKSGAGNLTLRRVTVERTGGDGLRLDDSRGEHTLERNTLAGNRVGVHVRNQTQTLVLTAHLLQNNTDFGVQNQNSVEVDARGNWWGHETGPHHAALNPEGQGDRVNDGVLFDPWRATPSAGEILSPVRSGTLVVGDLLRFRGSALAEPGATYRWNFSDGRTYSTREPGLVDFPQTGTVTVAYSAGTDGAEAPPPDTRTYSVVANSGNLPDLRVTQVRVAGNLAVGQTARIDYTVRNVGQGPAPAAWRDAVYLSRDAHLDREDIYLGSAVIHQDLPAGQSYQHTLHVTLPPVEEGAYHLILAVNDEWQVVELHRLNNEIAIPITRNFSFSTYYAMREALRRTEAGRALVDLFEAHSPELSTLLIENMHAPGLLDDAIAMLSEFQAGYARLLAGEGDSEFITQEMIDRVNRVADQFAELGSEALIEAIEIERARFNHLQDFVGVNFADWARILGVPVPESPWLVVSSARRLENGDLYFEVNHLPGHAYSVWRTSDLGAPEWVEVENALIEVMGHTARVWLSREVLPLDYYRVRAVQVISPE